MYIHIIQFFAPGLHAQNSAYFITLILQNHLGICDSLFAALLSRLRHHYFVEGRFSISLLQGTY